LEYAGWQKKGNALAALFFHTGGVYFQGAASQRMNNATFKIMDL
jgi:hypothetical protein